MGGRVRRLGLAGTQRAGGGAAEEAPGSRCWRWRSPWPRSCRSRACSISSPSPWSTWCSALRYWPCWRCSGSARPHWQRATVARPHAYADAIVPASVLLAALAYFVYMSFLTVGRHNAFLTHSHDLGIHDQVVYAILHGGVMRSTLYGEGAINYIGDHVSPIFYLLAPLYALRQDARTLLVLQSLFLARGPALVYAGARKTGSEALGVALALSYLLHPALHGANTFDFHQIVIAVPLLLLSLYFLEIGRDRPFLACLTLALLTREE